MAQQQQYRDPPPYPGHSKQVLNNQPGLRQSFSGSETSTDVSLSSTENLATWQRQEPQGEETQAPLYQQLDDGGYSILARLGMPSAALDMKGGQDPQVPSSLSFLSVGSHVSPYFAHPVHSQSVYASTCGPASQEDSTNIYSVVGNRNTLTVPHHWQAHGLPPPQSGQYARSVTPTYHHPHPYVNSQWSPGEGVATTRSSQNTQLLSYLVNLPPPPEYPGNKASDKKDICRSHERIACKVELTRSHPDLSRLSEPASSQGQPQSGTAPLGMHTASEPIFTIAASGSSGSGSQVKLQQLVAMLSADNEKLREELASCYKKVNKLQKLELEIQNVHEAYESLVKSSQKREILEAAVKSKLEEEVRRLRLQLEEVQAKSHKSAVTKQQSLESSLPKVKSESDVTISKLLSQNQQLASRQENLETQVANLQLSAAQHKAQRDLLNARLAAAQDNLCLLEDEVRKKDMQMGRVEQLQKAFTSLQTSSDRREEIEKQLRLHLERELDMYKSQEKGLATETEIVREEGKCVAGLQQLLSEKDKKILQLQSQLVKLEQNFSELQALRHMEDRTSTHEVQIAAWEESSVETGKLFDEAMSEKLQHIEELYQSNRRVAELEAKVKGLQKQLTEKEAMVKMYQRTPASLPRSSSVHTLSCSPLHSPRPSLIATTALTRPLTSTTASGSSNGDFVHARHVKTGSTSAIETGRKMSLDDTLSEQRQACHPVSKSDSEEETRLWQV